MDEGGRRAVVGCVGRTHHPPAGREHKKSEIRPELANILKKERCRIMCQLMGWLEEQVQ